MAKQTTHAKGLRIATQCETREQFVAKFNRFTESCAIFIPHANRTVGFDTAFAFTLTSGEVALAGVGTVLDQFPTSINRFGRPGIVIGIVRLQRDTQCVFDDMLVERALVVQREAALARAQAEAEDPAADAETVAWQEAERTAVESSPLTGAAQLGNAEAVLVATSQARAPDETDAMWDSDDHVTAVDSSPLAGVADLGKAPSVPIATMAESAQASSDLSVEWGKPTSVGERDPERTAVGEADPDRTSVGENDPLAAPAPAPAPAPARAMPPVAAAGKRGSHAPAKPQPGPRHEPDPGRTPAWRVPSIPVMRPEVASSKRPASEPSARTPPSRANAEPSARTPPHAAGTPVPGRRTPSPVVRSRDTPGPWLMARAVTAPIQIIDSVPFTRADAADLDAEPSNARAGSSPPAASTWVTPPPGQLSIPGELPETAPGGVADRIPFADSSGSVAQPTFLETPPQAPLDAARARDAASEADGVPLPIAVHGGYDDSLAATLASIEDAPPPVAPPLAPLAPPPVAPPLAPLAPPPVAPPLPPQQPTLIGFPGAHATPVPMRPSSGGFAHPPAPARARRGWLLAVTGGFAIAIGIGVAFAVHRYNTSSATPSASPSVPVDHEPIAPAITPSPAAPASGSAADVTASGEAGSATAPDAGVSNAEPGATADAGVSNGEPGATADAGANPEPGTPADAGVSNTEPTAPGDAEPASPPETKPAPIAKPTITKRKPVVKKVVKKRPIRRAIKKRKPVVKCSTLDCM